MDELAWIREGLADRRIGIVSEKTGLHKNTIARIRDGQEMNTKLETVTRLAAYLTCAGHE